MNAPSPSDLTQPFQQPLPPDANAMEWAFALAREALLSTEPVDPDLCAALVACAANRAAIREGRQHRLSRAEARNWLRYAYKELAKNLEILAAQAASLAFRLARAGYTDAAIRAEIEAMIKDRAVIKLIAPSIRVAALDGRRLATTKRTHPTL